MDAGSYGGYVNTRTKRACRTHTHKRTHTTGIPSSPLPDILSEKQRAAGRGKPEENERGEGESSEE